MGVHNACEDVLGLLARGTSLADDPVLGDEEQCVFWYGPKDQDDLAVMPAVKPGGYSRGAS